MVSQSLRIWCCIAAPLYSCVVEQLVSAARLSFEFCVLLYASAAAVAAAMFTILYLFSMAQGTELGFGNLVFNPDP